MQNQIIYQFPSGQIANRFLNDVNAEQRPHIKAKLYRGSVKVQVTYHYSDTGFDSTSAELDDLARRYDGEEVS
ncbi:hypothetical protein [Aliiglaciecola lipolytica]|uniref:Uncharacterized protein n=1 Tax=Aliiglaciecola lipolytica E3 TaxID=1127673 RepID=K6YC03_9ALTE|nr:hypothetical protein [Aliiglaciecola lipolytica]GAC15732.1 hypothetical protein GLIP_3111 [Aliiglaciecola lipolytica E3]